MRTNASRGAFATCTSAGSDFTVELCGRRVRGSTLWPPMSRPSPMRPSRGKLSLPWTRRATRCRCPRSSPTPPGCRGRPRTSWHSRMLQQRHRSRQLWRGGSWRRPSRSRAEWPLSIPSSQRAHPLRRRRTSRFPPRASWSSSPNSRSPRRCRCASCRAW